MEATHKQLLKICKGMEEWKKDYEKYGQNPSIEKWEVDCSCGCKFFHELRGGLGADWGVCWNPKSPRAGLLTFEHMGCKEYKDE